MTATAAGRRDRVFSVSLSVHVTLYVLALALLGIL